MATLILLGIIIGYTIFIVVLMSEPKAVVQAVEAPEPETKTGDQLVLDLRDVEPIPAADTTVGRGEFAFFEQIGPAAEATQTPEQPVPAPREVWHINDVPRRLGSPHVLDLRPKN
jgi:hypothetical protein